MVKRNLNDRKIQSLKYSTAMGRTDTWDALVPGLGVRVSKTGKNFVLMARYPGSQNPTRRALGGYGELTLERARAKARNWLELIRQGIDPADAEEEARQAELRKRAATFASVAEAY